MAPVNIQNVQKRFGAVNVIHGIDIDIADGEFVVLSDHRDAENRPVADDRRAGKR